MKQVKRFCKRLLPALLSLAMVFTSFNMPAATIQAQAAGAELNWVETSTGVTVTTSANFAAHDIYVDYVLKFEKELQPKAYEIALEEGEHVIEVVAFNNDGTPEEPVWTEVARESKTVTMSGSEVELTAPSAPSGVVCGYWTTEDINYGKIKVEWGAGFGTGGTPTSWTVYIDGEIVGTEKAVAAYYYKNKYAEGEHTVKVIASNEKGDSEATTVTFTLTAEQAGDTTGGEDPNPNPDVETNLIDALTPYVDTAVATIDNTTTPGTYVIDITKKGNANYHVQLTDQPDLVVDTVYNLSFDIQAEKDAKVEVAVQNRDYNASILGATAYDVPGGDVAHFSLNTAAATFIDGNVAFMFGNQDINVNNTITLSNVTMTAGAKTENIPSLTPDPEPEPVDRKRVVISEQEAQAFVNEAVVLKYVASEDDFAFGDDYTVKIDGTDVDKANVTINDGTIALAASLFTEEKVYTIQFGKEGYEVTPAYQRVYAQEDKTSDDKWTLIWQDEFDGTEIDPKKWDYQTGTGAEYGVSGWGNEEEEYYTDSPENSKVADGTLTITAKKDSTYAGAGKNYTSARIRTVTEDIVDGKAQTGTALQAAAYGRVEAKMKMPAGDGIWPAFWLLPHDSEYGTWATSGELDIMEARGRLPQEVGGTIHYGGVWPNNVYKGRTYKFAGDDSIEQYHIYAVEWDPTEITWLVDGEEYGSLTNWYAEAGEEGNWPYPAPFDEEFYVLLNLAVGGTYDTAVKSEDIEVDANGVEMDVDYVRWYQRDAEVYEEWEIGQPVTEKDDSETAQALLELADEDGNFIVNGDFSNTNIPVYKGSDTWDIKRGNWFGLTENTYDGEAAWDYVEKDGETYAKINVSEVGSQPYSSQMIQYFPLVEGYEYEISYVAYTDNANPKADISLKMGGDDDNGWGVYSGNYTDDLTTTPTKYSHKFAMTSETDGTARFEFNLATSAGNVYISDVSVKLTTIDESEGEDDAKEPLSDGNHVYNGEFMIGTDSLLYWHWSNNDSKEVVSATKENGERVAKVTVGETPVSMWQYGMNLLQNDSYKLTFKVNGAEEQDIKVAFTNADGTETYAEATKSVAAGAQDVEVTFTQPKDKTDEEAKMVITFEKTASLDKVKLVRTTNNNVDYDSINMWPMYNGDFFNGKDGWNIWNQGAGGITPSVNEAGQLSAQISMGSGAAFYDAGIQSKEMTLTKGIKYKVKFDYTLPSAKNYKLELAGVQRDITLEAGSHTYVSEAFLGGGNTNFTLYLGPDQTAEYNLLLDNVVVYVDPEFLTVPEGYAQPVNMKQVGRDTLNIDVTMTYVEDAAWESAEKTYYLNGEEIDAEDVTIDTEANTFVIAGSHFKVGGAHSFAVKAEGYSITQNAKITVLPTVSRLLNGDFSDGENNWTFYRADWDGASGGSFKVEDGVAVINHIWDSGETWHFQLSQDDILYYTGKYVMSFDAWVDTIEKRPIVVQLQEGNGAAFAGTYQTPMLTQEKQTFNYIIDLDAHNSAKINFMMGSNLTVDGVAAPNDGTNPYNIYLDNVVLRPVMPEQGDTEAETAKAELTTLIEQYASLVEADYTADSWAAYQTALAAAKEAVAKDGATAEELTKAKEDLQAAYEALVKATADPEQPREGLWIKCVKSKTYTGSAIKLTADELQVYEGDTLLSSKDYSVSYKDNKNAGTATVTVKGKGNYSGSDTATFEILKKDVADLSAADVYAIIDAKTGTVKKNPKVTVKYGKITLQESSKDSKTGLSKENKDYTLTWPNVNGDDDKADAATDLYKITITGNGNYTGTKEINYDVLANDIMLMSKASIKINNKVTKIDYFNQKVLPTFDVKIGTTALVAGVDYEIKGFDNLVVGKNTLTFVSKNPAIYGTKTFTVTVTGAKIDAKNITVSGVNAAGYLYTGDEITVDNLEVLKKTVSGNETSYTPLAEGEDRDYTVKYDKNINAGTAKITITGVNGYTGKKTVSFKIKKVDMTVSGNNVELITDSVATYNKKGATVDVKVTYNGREVDPSNYKVSYKNNTKVTAGGATPAKVTVTGKGNFTKSLTNTFVVESSDATAVTLTVDDMIVPKNLNQLKPKMTIVEKGTNKKLTAGKDYERVIAYGIPDAGEPDGYRDVTLEDLEVNNEITAIVTLMGNYGDGETTVVTDTFRLYAVKASTFKVAKIGDQVFVAPGVEIEPSLEGKVTVKVRENGNTVEKPLHEGTDYQVVDYINNDKVGTAKIVIEGLGEYGGTKTVTFKITKKPMDFVGVMSDFLSNFSF